MIRRTKLMRAAPVQILKGQTTELSSRFELLQRLWNDPAPAPDYRSARRLCNNGWRWVQHEGVDLGEIRLQLLRSQDKDQSKGAVGNSMIWLHVHHKPR